MNFEWIVIASLTRRAHQDSPCTTSCYYVGPHNNKLSCMVTLIFLSFKAADQSEKGHYCLHTFNMERTFIMVHAPTPVVVTREMAQCLDEVGIKRVPNNSSWRGTFKMRISSSLSGQECRQSCFIITTGTSSR